MQRTVEVPNATTAQAMRDFMSVQGKPVPEKLILKPRGNGVEVLVHWRFPLYVISVLGKVRQESLRELSGLKRICFLPFQRRLTVIATWIGFPGS